MLLVCFGIDVFFNAVRVSFPASVAGMILLFLALVVSELVLGGVRTRRIANVVDISVGVEYWD